MMDRPHLPYTVSDSKFEPGSFQLVSDPKELLIGVDGFGNMLNDLVLKVANAAEVDAAHKLVGIILERLGGDMIISHDELASYEGVHYTFKHEYIESLDSVKLTAIRGEPDDPAV